MTPGFVDLHTHLDAQIGWDPLLTSSCWHGVTSVVMGNCGVTFAPVRPEDRGFLAEMMESVEDIPARSILDGIPWSWETYGEYLDVLDLLPKGINVGGMVGHCAVRYHAMGDRSLARASRADRRRARSDGAPGRRSDGAPVRLVLQLAHAAHRVPDGRYVPGTWAGPTSSSRWPRCSALAAGVVESAPRFDGDGPAEPRVESELAEPSYAISGGLTFGGVVPSVELVVFGQFLAQGYTVIVPDTEGQRADFAAGPEYGMNTLDSIRAAFNSPTVGLPSDARVALLGYSGGAIATSGPPSWRRRTRPTPTST